MRISDLTHSITEISLPEWLIAYRERFENEKVEDSKSATLIYLNNDEIPECIFWLNPFIDYDSNEVYGYRTVCVLSYKNGEILEFNSDTNCNITFSYTERLGQFSLKEVLGLRSATWWEIIKLTNDFKKIGSAWTDNDIAMEPQQFFQVNEKDVDGEEMFQYLHSFGFQTTLTESDWHSSIIEAYNMLNKGISLEKNYDYILPDSDLCNLLEQTGLIGARNNSD